VSDASDARNVSDMSERSKMERFFAEFAERTGTATVTADEAGAVLELAREVAHTAERKYAPIATYALGLAVGAAEPAARVEIARRVIEAVQDDAG
jgi:hypothetical protein